MVNTLNLLPDDRRVAVRKSYVVRVVTVALWLIVILIVIGGLLLTPTYIFLSGTLNAKENRLAAIQSTLSSSADANLSKRLTDLSTSAVNLITITKSDNVSSLMRSVLAVPHPDISLTNFTYAPVAGKNPATLTIGGVSDTRDALRSYQLALSSASFAKDANLPVSTYAKETDLPFIITITLAP